MPLTILLDTSPLGTVTKQKGRSDAEECREWVRVCRRRGHQVLVPAVAYYEVARELERQNNYHGLQRLELFCSTSDCYLPLTDCALRLAAKLWARSRKAGMPTADPKELDCDVLIAAQTLELRLPPTEVIVATMNPGHLSHFVASDLWQNIKP